MPTSNITFVGAFTGGSSSSADYNINLSGLLENDLVVVMAGAGDYATQNNLPTITTAGYSGSLADLAAPSGTYRAKAQYRYKFMGSTPDTVVACTGTGNSFDSCGGVAYVFRGVDQTNPLDVAIVTAVVTGGQVVNPPAISPITDGAMLIVLGSAVADVGDTTITPPSGFSNGVDARYNSNGYFHAVAAMKIWGGTAPEDPPAWTNWTDSSSASYVVATLALRPAVPNPPLGGGKQPVVFVCT